MTPFLRKVADVTGKPLRDIESVWFDCRAAVSGHPEEKEKTLGTANFVRACSLCVEQLGLSFSEISL